MGWVETKLCLIVCSHSVKVPVAGRLGHLMDGVSVWVGVDL